MKTPVVAVLLWLPSAVFAIQMSGLYEAEVAVQDQLAEHSGEAIRTAMRVVLVKVTGDRFAARRTSLQPVIEQAGEYVQQYRYVRQPGGPDPEAEPDDGLRLRVIFDEQTLNEALRGIGVPVWGKERPTTLVWLAIEDDSGRHIATMEENTGLLRQLEQRARRRGIHLMFPLMDLHERGNIQSSDVWGGFSAQILQASEPYQADTVLVGKVISPVPGIWESQWTSLTDEGATRWMAEGLLPEIVLEEGVDGQANLLASRFVGTGASLATVQLSILVHDVTTADHYARALKYLRSLSSVTDVQLNEARPGQVRFSITAHGGEVAIKRAIALGRQIEPIAGEQENSYRLLP